MRLCALQVSGLPTNVEFLKRLCAHPAFAACDLDTSFIARHLDELLQRTTPSAEVLALAAVTDHLLQSGWSLLAMAFPPHSQLPGTKPPSVALQSSATVTVNITNDAVTWV